LPVETTRELEEGAGGDSVICLVKQHSGRDLVFCTHGDVVEELMEGLIAQGIVPRARANAEKGSTWVLDERDGEVRGAKYLPAP
jgi:hypothetical protein